MQPQLPHDLHVQIGTTAERLAAVLAETVAALPQEHFYVFLAPAGGGATRSTPGSSRTIPAFRSPDDAVTFAQWNGGSAKIRVRPITALDLLRYMLATPTIGTVLFLHHLPDTPVTQQFPPGAPIRRTGLLIQLQPDALAQEGEADIA
ncbi:MAG: hypothetical protein NVSMB42_22980 [Herpetosiphon sp.]